MLHERTRELALKMTAMASVTGTEGERDFPSALRELILGMPCFRDRPDLVRVVPLPGDQTGRSCLVALLRGEGERTIVLTGHFDVVDPSPYGELANLAFSPEALRDRLVQELRSGAGASEAADSLALRDLESGDFLPGRGLLDMKAGLAAGLAVMEEFASAPGRPCNLLFLAVPDEEGGSAGMRAAVAFMPSLLDSWGLRALAAINLDSAVDPGDGRGGRAVFLGSVGKTHPFTLFLGRPCHAGAPFEGLSAALLAAEFLRRVECSPEAGDPPSADGAPPPAVLYVRDLRKGYDVTTPAAILVSLNVLSQHKSPGEVLATLARIASESMDAALGLIIARAKRQEADTGIAASPPVRPARALLWSELAALAAGADPIATAAATKTAALSTCDAAVRCGEAAEALARIAGLEGPAVVLGLAPPFYPRAELDPERDGKLLAAVTRAAAGRAEACGETISLRPFFPGISDMSLLYPSGGDGDAAWAERESPFPAVATHASDSPEAAGSFRVPTINAGPWGRDYHQKLERLHVRYSFETLPDLLCDLIKEISETV